MTDLPQETGDERVDRALTGLDRLGALPVGEHVAVFEEIHAGLERTLAVRGVEGEGEQADAARQ
ncbi:hypothetical protein [Streptosporangium sp. KLBMP 9127]|nr:hypothetical protein [Streptosporangium sp. KLBMP 9127]